MPIRMEEDPQQPRREDTGGQQKGGINLLNFLPFILMFLFKKPKLLIPIILVLGVLYFLGAFDGCLGSQSSDIGGDSESTGEFTFGATLDQERFDRAEVFEPLSAEYGAPGLPKSVSLLQYAPRRMHQGTQGSCVGWASSYSACTILHAKATGTSPEQNPFSPSFLYNQIALEGCQGAYMLDAMQTLKDRGTLPFKYFGYTDETCSDMPNTTELEEAKKYRIKGFNRLTVGAQKYEPDINAIRQNLAQGAPVVIGMMVGGTFMQGMMGQKLWQPTQRDYTRYGFSGHAMSVIGYDDTYAGGAFQIMNSWGPEWGDNGVAWVRYDDFRHFVKEAYGLYPMGTPQTADPNKLAVRFGLVDNASQSLIPLRKTGSMLFSTERPIRIGQKFKIAITNSIECYTYVFGEETDGSSYVLFPYTPKHSAYCGIVGTRVFPRDYSMVADNLGTKDRIAVVVTKNEIDFNRLNTLINASRQGSYQNKLAEVLREITASNVTFGTAGGAIDFAATLNGKNAVAVVIEIDKQ